MGQWKEGLEGLGAIMIVLTSLLVGYYIHSLLGWLKEARSKKHPVPRNVAKAVQDPPVRRELDEGLRAHVHESGHVIAAWLDPHVEEVYGVVVFRDGLSTTDTDRDDDVSHDGRTSSAWWYEAVYHLAGLAAETKIYGDIPKEEVRGYVYDLCNARDAITEGLRHDEHNFDRTPWMDHVVAPSPSAPSLGDCFEEGDLPPDEVIKILDKAFAHAKSLIASQSDRLRQLVFAMQDGHGHLCHEEIATTMGARDTLPRREVTEKSA